MKYLVFDRDGTLINHVNYLCDPKKVELIDGVKSSLNKIHNNEKFQFFLHTNQSGVFRRYFKMDDVIKCNNRLLELLGFGDNFFSEICISIENPTISKSTTRKPSPLFGRRLIKRYSIDKNNLFYIGDNITDLLTAKALGCYGLGLENSNYNIKNYNYNYSKIKTFKSFNSLLNFIIKK